MNRVPVPLLALALVACAKTPAPQVAAIAPVETEAEPVQALPGLYATAWLQGAAEYAATTTTVYNAAAHHLDAAIADPSWRAIAGDEGSDDRPPAIILDLDETVLDNSPWQVRAMRGGFAYPQGWNDWCNEAQARAIPGATAFLTAAAAKGVTIFYVSNREAVVEAGTRKNLESLGLPLSTDLDTVLLQDEQPGWGSDKTSRREVVAQTHRVLFLFGDTLGDFVEAGRARDARHQAVDDHADWWGTRWFALPNPAYGSWQGANVRTTPETPERPRDARLLESLDDKTGD